jgi:hypothetical protein
LNILDTVFKILNEFRCIYLSVRNHCTLDYSIHVLNGLLCLRTTKLTTN